MISWDCTEDELAIIKAICERVHAYNKANGHPKYPHQDLMMDLIACHANGMPMNFQKLLDADDFTFVHDIYGIYRHIDRTTGEIGDCFVPRCADPQNDPVNADDFVSAIFGIKP